VFEERLLATSNVNEQQSRLANDFDERNSRKGHRFLEFRLNAPFLAPSKREREPERRSRFAIHHRMTEREFHDFDIDRYIVDVRSARSVRISSVKIMSPHSSDNQTLIKFSVHLWFLVNSQISVRIIIIITTRTTHIKICLASLSGDRKPE